MTVKKVVLCALLMLGTLVTGSCKIITASGVSAIQTAQAETIATAVAATCEAMPTNTPHITSTPEPATIHRGLTVNCSSSLYQDDELCQGCSCEKALDGDLNTRWATTRWGPRGEEDNAHFIVWFSAPVVIDTVILVWEDAYGRAYSIDVSTDGVNWTTVYEEVNGDGRRDEIHFLPTTAKYVRWVGRERGTEHGYSLWEIMFP